MTFTLPSMLTPPAVQPPASKPPILQPPTSFEWAVVTQVSPLLIRLEKDTDALPITPSTLAPPGLRVGDRVWTQTVNGSVLILGRGQGGIDTLGRLNTQLTGGGIRFLDSTGISWSDRFICMSVGHNSLTSVGYFNIDFPTNGTVIPVHGGGARTQVTVASGGIGLSAWDTLWYEPNLGGDGSSSSARFHIVYYGNDFTPPSTWWYLGCLNYDLFNTFVWFDGRETASWKNIASSPGFLNSWVNYASGGYELAQMKRENGIVYTKGLIKSGTLGSGGAFLLPDGYRPLGNIQWATNASGGVADIRILSGYFCVYALYSGTTASVSIQGSWPADV